MMGITGHAWYNIDRGLQADYKARVACRHKQCRLRWSLSQTCCTSHARYMQTLHHVPAMQHYTHTVCHVCHSTNQMLLVWQCRNNDSRHACSPAAKLRDESLQSAEQMAILRRQGCSAGRSTGCPWPQYKLPSGAYVFPADVNITMSSCCLVQAELSNVRGKQTIEEAGLFWWGVCWMPLSPESPGMCAVFCTD